MTYWEWAMIILLVTHSHYRVMQNKKSISNLFCILEDHNINITRVFKPLTLWEAWSGDIIDPPPLPAGTDVLEAFRRERDAKETRREARRKWWGRAIFGAVIAAIFIYVWLAQGR
jgi:hypothetical protein